MKTLDLVLKRKWYDMIASREKTEEYREIKPYWIRRLCENRYIGCNHPTKVTSHAAIFYSENAHFLETQIGLGGMAFLNFDKVTFHLGYSKDRPSMTFAIKEIVIGEGKEEWGAFLGKQYFVIKLSKRIS